MTRDEAIKQLEQARKRGLVSLFKASSLRHGVPYTLLLAIASRETAIGQTYNAQGRGDCSTAGCPAHGIMQIDERWHKPYTSTHSPLDHAANIDYAAKYLKSLYAGNWRDAARKYNGSGAKAEAYADDVMSRKAIFEELEGGEMGNSGITLFVVGAALFAAWSYYEWQA